jgi:hypothetical protein
MHYLAIQLAKCSEFYLIITPNSLKCAYELNFLVRHTSLTANASVVAEARKLTYKPILIMYDAIASAQT